MASYRTWIPEYGEAYDDYIEVEAVSHEQAAEKRAAMFDKEDFGLATTESSITVLVSFWAPERYARRCTVRCAMVPRYTAIEERLP